MKEKWHRIRKDKDYRIQFIIIILLISAIIAVVLPIVVASSMAFYRGDDFSGIVCGNKRSIPELVLDSLRYAKGMFLNWEGAYFSTFIVKLFNPLLGKGLPQLRLIMVINAMLFIVGLCIFVYGLFKQEAVPVKHRLLLCFCCFLGILGFEVWYQIFYWFTGAMYYTVPLSLALIALGLIFLSNKRIIYVIAGVLLFCASGGNLAVAAIECYWLLMMVISKMLKKSACKKDYVLFVIAVGGALLNALAPGNFARNSVIDDSGLHPFRAVIFSFSEVVATAEWLFLDTFFIIIAIIAFSIGVLIGKRQSVNNTYSWVMIGLNAFIPVVTYFPVCLGYNSGGGPNRCRFMLTLAFVISAISILVFLGQILSARIWTGYKREVIIMLLLLLIIMPIKREGWKFSSMIPYRTLMKLTEGRIQSYYRGANEIYDTIREDENEDVFLFTMPISVDEFLSMDIKEDPNYLINTECADYFGKKSVQYVSGPVYVNGDGETYIRIAPSYFEHDLQFVSIFNNSDSQGMETIQILQPFEKNLLIHRPLGDTGTVSIYVFADSNGDELLEEMEISY